MYKMKDGRVVLTPKEVEVIGQALSHAIVVVDVLEAAAHVDQGFPEVRLLRALQECHELGITPEAIGLLTTPVAGG